MTSSPAIAFARRHVRTLLALSMVATLAFALWARRDDLAAFDWSVNPLALTGAALLLAVPGLVQAGTFVVALRRVGAGARWRPALKVWARSWLLRYEPSGAVGFAYRVGARERLEATTPQVLTATAYEQLAAIAGGALAAPIGFAIAGLQPPAIALVAAAVAVLTLVALRPAWLGGWVQRRLQARGIAAAAPLRGRAVAVLVAVHAAGWAATAGGVALLAGALGLGRRAGRPAWRRRAVVAGRRAGADRARWPRCARCRAGPRPRAGARRRRSDRPGGRAARRRVRRRSDGLCDRRGARGLAVARCRDRRAGARVPSADRPLRRHRRGPDLPGGRVPPALRGALRRDRRRVADRR